MSHPRSILITLILFLSACQAAPATPLVASTAAVSTPRATAQALLVPTAATKALLATPPTPTQASNLAPGPTLYPNLLHRVPDEIIPSLPEGLGMELYKLAVPPFADEGYEPVVRALGAQSRLSKLVQGRYVWDTASLARMEADNAALAPFGYRLESKPVEAGTGERSFTLYKGGKIVLDPISSPGPVSINRSGTDFMMIVIGAAGDQLVRNGALASWKSTDGKHSNSRPQFLGDEVMHVEISQDPPATPSKTPAPPGMLAELFRGDQVIYSLHFQMSPAALDLIGFWTYGEHWALETVDHVVIDGKDVNATNGFDKSYEFHLLNGKPLYFFEKAGALGVSYDGKTAPLPFPSIPHYGCCSAGEDNPLQIGEVLMFYGVQGGNWFYAEMGEKEYGGP